VLIRVHAGGLDQGIWHGMAGMPYMVRLSSDVVSQLTL
jgi:hypothetical protein